MKKFILICFLTFGNSVFAEILDYDNPPNSLICTVYTKELGYEVRMTTPFNEKGAVLDELVGGRYMLTVVAKSHRCILSTDVKDLLTGQHGKSFGTCSVSSYAGSKNSAGEFMYYHFCKTTDGFSRATTTTCDVTLCDSKCSKFTGDDYALCMVKCCGS